MSEFAVVHEGDGAAQLHRDVRHLRRRVRHVPVALEEIEHRLAQHLERQADVAVVAGIERENSESCMYRVTMVVRGMGGFTMILVIPLSAWFGLANGGLAVLAG